jgi:hypothetical protein
MHFLFPHIRVERLIRTILTRQWDDDGNEASPRYTGSRSRPSISSLYVSSTCNVGSSHVTLRGRRKPWNGVVLRSRPRRRRRVCGLCGPALDVFARDRRRGKRIPWKWPRLHGDSIAELPELT